MKATVSDLNWVGDNDGHEVGYPEVTVVGTYHSDVLKATVLIDMETSEIIEAMPDEEEEEE
jgi:hypothetical protein